jgi:hypothetical protein
MSLGNQHNNKTDGAAKLGADLPLPDAVYVAHRAPSPILRLDTPTGGLRSRAISRNPGISPISPVMSAKNTLEARDSFSCSAYVLCFEPYKSAVNKLASPRVGKVK